MSETLKCEKCGCDIGNGEIVVRAPPDHTICLLCYNKLQKPNQRFRHWEPQT